MNMNIQKSLSTKTQLNTAQPLLTSIPLDPSFLSNYIPSMKFSTIDSSVLQLTLKKINSCLNNESKSTLTLAEVKFQELFFQNKNLLFDSLNDNTTIRNNTFNNINESHNEMSNSNINGSSNNSNNENIKKWYLLINVISTLIRLSKIKTQQINLDSIDDYLPMNKQHNDKVKVNKVNCYQNKSHSNSNSTASLAPLEIIKDQLELFYYLSNGLEKMKRKLLKY